MLTENNVAAQAGDEPIPCPFCGSGAHVFGAYNAFAVNCTECNAYGPSMDRQGALDGWNKRYVAAGTLTDDGTKVSPRATADVERLDFIEAHPELHLQFHKKHWALRGFTNYEFTVFKKLRDAIDAAIATTMPGA